jgi:alkylation response protein AidB-like acyl-CoA dehydrogenase
MDFRLTPEQLMLRQSAQRFISDRTESGSLRGSSRTGPADNWQGLAELGYLLLPLPESSGGLGGSFADIGIVAEELGRGLAPDPFAECALLPARLIDFGGSDQQRAELLPALGAGEARFAVGLLEPGQRFDLVPSLTTADRDANGYRISGCKVLVSGGLTANKLVISAQVDRQPSLFVIDAEAAGIERRDYPALDGRLMSDFRFERVSASAAQRLSGPADVLAIIEQATDEAVLTLCADAVGCMEQAIAFTTEYLQVRRQFGRALADFQALQHGVANLFIDANDARSSVYRAMSVMQGTNLQKRRRAVSGCKVKVMSTGRSVTGAAVHYHGGIGFTPDAGVGRCYLRLLVLEQALGNTQTHFERFFELSHTLRATESSLGSS